MADIREAGPAVPVLSICIPTYNRAPYLRRLLPYLAEGIKTFPHAVEVVISDNASTDETPDLLREYSTRAPLRVFRQPENRGAYPNVIHALSLGLGTFLVYQGDDDFLDFAGLAEIVTRLRDNPRLAVAYAPWQLYDLVDDKVLGTFYRQTEDIVVRRDDHRGLLEHVLRLHAFTEIGVVRRTAWQLMQPRINDVVFWAFVDASNYLGVGDVLLSATPFYRSVTRYFPGPPRLQLGNEEVEVAWDRYRGGLEFMVARAASQVGSNDRQRLLAQVDQFVALRMLVALRMRLAKNRDAVEAWYLACRLRSHGLEKHFPAPMQALAIRAALWFVAHGEGHLQPPSVIVCDSSIKEEFRTYLRSLVGDRVLEAALEEKARDGVLLVASDDSADERRRLTLAQRNIRVVSLTKVMVRFQL